MSELRVSNAFGVQGLELAVSGEVANLLAPLSNPADEIVLQVKAGTSSGAIGLFDQALEMSGEAGAKMALAVHTAGGSVKDPFGLEMAPGHDQRFCDLTLEGALRAKVSDTASSGPFRFSASASAGAELEYRRLFPVAADSSLDDIARLALQGARFPGRFFDRSLLPGEGHRFAGRLRFGLDANLGAGFESQFGQLVELFRGFSPEVRATAQATVSAALGLSLFESTEIVVFRPLDAAEDRMRLRLARVRQRGLTFGAKVALGLTTNIGTVLNKTLDHVFALEPVADVFAAWKEIAGFAEAKTWDELKAKLSRRAVDSVLGLFRRYVELDKNATVDKLLGELAAVLKTWDGIDEVIQDLWADVLAKGGLTADSSLEDLLAKVAALGSAASREEALAKLARPETAADGRFLGLVELLAGETLENLISSPEVGGLEATLGRVAKKAQDALDRMKAGPVPKVLEALQKFAQESGIGTVVEKLRDIPTAEGLQEAVELPVRKVAEKLFNKAWEKLETRELTQLKQWAETVAAELKDFQQWEKKLRADLQRLDERFGVTLCFELSRQFHQEAFLDVDLHGRIWERASFQDDLRNGDLPAVIRRLTQAATAEETDVAIEIRECAFLTRRIRSCAWCLLIEALGFKFLREVGSLRTLQKLERITESGTTVELRGASERFAKAQSGTNKEAWRSKAELELTAALAGERFAPTVAKVVLEVLLEDDKMLEGERKALDHLLAEMGLAPIGGQEGVEPASRPNIRFSLTVQFAGTPAELLAAVAQASGRKALLAAVERLYRDELVGADEAAFEPGLRAGTVMAAMLRAPGFKKALQDPAAMSDFLRKHKAKVGKRSLDLFDNLAGIPVRSVASLASLPTAVNGRWPGLANETGKALANTSRENDVASWEKVTRAFVTQHKALVLDGYSVHPMLGFYVFFSALASSPAVAVHAAASLQFKTGDASGEWSAPRFWQR